MFYFAIVLGNMVSNGIVIGDPEQETKGAMGCFDDLDAAEVFIKRAFGKYADCLAPRLVGNDHDLELFAGLPDGLELKALYSDIELDIYNTEFDPAESLRDAKLVGGIVEVPTPWTMWT